MFAANLVTVSGIRSRVDDGLFNSTAAFDAEFVFLQLLVYLVQDGYFHGSPSFDLVKFTVVDDGDFVGYDK